MYRIVRTKKIIPKDIEIFNYKEVHKKYIEGLKSFIQQSTTFMSTKTNGCDQSILLNRNSK